MNERSSRSHHVFQIKITRDSGIGNRAENMLNIIDLAGSERRVDMQKISGIQ
jgi:hypothetical protein